MSEYTPYIPYALYAIPFVVAVIVLIRAKIDEIRAAREEEALGEEPVLDVNDPLIEECRSRPIYRQYVRYGV